MAGMLELGPGPGRLLELGEIGIRVYVHCSGCNTSTQGYEWSFPIPYATWLDPGRLTILRRDIEQAHQRHSALAHPGETTHIVPDLDSVFGPQQ